MYRSLSRQPLALRGLFSVIIIIIINAWTNNKQLGMAESLQLHIT
jgi:hypothetical protein